MKVSDIVSTDDISSSLEHSRLDKDFLKFIKYICTIYKKELEGDPETDPDIDSKRHELLARKREACYRADILGSRVLPKTSLYSISMRLYNYPS